MAKVSHGTRISVIAATALCAAAILIGWAREPRTFRTDPPVSAELARLRLMPNGISGTPPDVYFAMGKPYEAGGYDLGQGKRLYAWFGCSACHGDGRGGKGPAFLDGWWFYGPSMVSIAASIRDG